MVQIVKQVQEFAAGRGKHPMMTLVSEPGLGKSHLLVAATWDYVLKQQTCAYWRTESMLGHIKSGFNAPDPTEPNIKGLNDYERRMGFVQRCGLLALDDFGAHADTDFARAKLDEIIDARYAERRLTLIATNVDLDKLQPRIRDRLKEGVILFLKGRSYREIIAERRRKGEKGGSN